MLLDAKTLDSYRYWAVGSLAGRGEVTATAVVPVVAVGLALAVANARNLDVLALGDDVAESLGLPVGLARATGLLAVTLLTAAAVAACGPIAFIGLLAGHLARTVVGPRWMPAVVTGAVTGAGLLLTADVLGRLVPGPGELAVGVVSGILGAPVLLWLVRRRAVAL